MRVSELREEGEAMKAPEKLEAESAKLRVERDEWKRVAESKQKRIDALVELICDMLSDFEEQMHGPTIYPQTWYVAYKIWAQKLGIEVD